MNVAGIDVGRSAVKVAAVIGAGEIGGERVSFLFPSVVTQAIDISDEATRKSAERETVDVNGQRFFTGETAILQGRGTSMLGLSDDWIRTPTHDALLVSALKRLAAGGCPIGKGDMLLLGLPAKLHGSQKEDLKKICAKYTEAQVMVLPQPMGPYQYEMLSAMGYPKPGRSFTSESWGVVDVGHYTTDFMLMIGKNWIEAASGSCPGIHLAAEKLQRILADRHTLDLVEAEEVLRKGYVLRFGKPVRIDADIDRAVEPVVQGIINEAQSKIAPYVHKLDGVLVAGGGATLVCKGLEAIWPHAKLVSIECDGSAEAVAHEARMSVAEGFLRYGLAQANILRQHQIAA